MIKQAGFTLIEALILIVVTGFLATTVLMSLNTTSLNTPALETDTIGIHLAQQCLEWFLGQRRLLGYSAFSCPSTSKPAFCTTISGYTVAVNVACTTINSDANYQTITVTVTGRSTTSLSTLVANY